MTRHVFLSEGSSRLIRSILHECTHTFVLPLYIKKYKGSLIKSISENPDMSIITCDGVAVATPELSRAQTVILPAHRVCSAFLFVLLSSSFL